MNVEAISHVAAAIILSIGGSGLIVIGLSSWLGKLWADRLMARETQRHSKQLENLRSQLQTLADRHSQNYRHKIELYKEVANPLVELIVKAQHAGLTKQDFDTARLSTTALLGMFAPTSVFNSYNNLIDYVYDAFEGKKTWSYPVFRVHALELLSLIRTDIGITRIQRNPLTRMSPIVLVHCAEVH